MKIIIALVFFAATTFLLQALFSPNAVTVTGNLASLAKSVLEIITAFKQR